MNSNDTGYIEIELKRIERDRSVWLKKYFNMLDLISDKKKEYSRKIIFIMLLIGLIVFVRLYQIYSIYNKINETRVYKRTIYTVIIDIITNQHLLFFLFICLGIYVMNLILKFYAIFKKKESRLSFYLSVLLNVKNYYTELKIIEGKILEYNKLEKEIKEKL